MHAKSVEQLENDFWGEPDPDESRTVRQSFQLRRKPIGKLDAEELRFLIGQDIGVRFLVPLAVEKLEQDLLAEGDYYPGDLLSSVLRVSDSYWRANPALRERLLSLLDAAPATIGAAELSSEIKDDLLEQIERFRAAS